jgi:hypothetical protein
MRWLNRILGAMAKPAQEPVRHPGGGFDSAAAAIAEIVRRHRAAGEEGWVHLEASAPGAATEAGRSSTKVTIQVMRDRLNLLLEELPPHAAEALGLERIEEGLYRMADASPEDIAATIDALIDVHFGLGAGYAVEGRVEG